MQPLPDITPILKGGIVGILLSIIVALCGVIAWFIKNHVTSTSAKHTGPPREALSGEKPTDYWEKVFADIETEGNKALLAILSEHHRALMEQLGKLRARLRESNQVAALTAVKEFRAKYDQDMIAIAKMLRAIEAKIEEHERTK